MYAITFSHDSRYLDKIFKAEKFDLILLDPPCSSMGVRPKLFDRKTYREIKSYSLYQRQFLKVAYKLLKPKGVLVYSTCTYTLEENEDVISFGKKLGFKYEEIPEKYLVGERCFLDCDGCCMRIFPDKIDTTGFFIAVLRK
jgi:16S rRNA (cytosine967-C5)-methyltransferase